MAAEILQAIDALTQRLLAIAAQDADLRSHLRSLAQAILSATEAMPGAMPVLLEPPPAKAETTPRELVPPPISQSLDAIQPPRPAATVPPHEDVSPHPSHPFNAAARPEPPPIPAEVRPRHWLWSAAEAGEFDLATIEARCRLKAEGARWSVIRRRRLAEGAHFRTEIDPQDREIIARAKALPDCFLWMNTPDWLFPADTSLVEDVAGCFEAVADAVALIQAVMADMENEREVFRQALDLTAEAQSSLRAAILRIDGPTDTDQIQVFSWLKATADQRRVFIRRFMRADDVANPREWMKLADRIETLGRQVEEVRDRGRRRKKLLGKLRHKVQTINTGEEATQEERWQALAAATEELLQTGVPPSNLEIRDLLLPILDDMPELADLPEGFRLVLREIDRYMASRPNANSSEILAGPTAEVKETARLLGGKSIVLIGGARRPDALENLKTSFDLKDLFWIETREHQSLEGFEPYIARPDVVVVLLAIRWSSHSFGEVRQFCEQYGKPLVRLPGGYHPNQVAHQILTQCGERLAGTA